MRRIHSDLVRQSGGERQQLSQRGLMLLATCSASRRSIDAAVACPWPSAAHSVMQLAGRRPAGDRRWAFTEAARRRSFTPSMRGAA